VQDEPVFSKEERVMISRSFSWPRAACSLVLLISVLLTACGTTFQSPATSAKSSAPIQVVAAENFWGSIAAQVGGSHVHVSSIIVDPNADPHSYEPTNPDARLVAQA
jgi:zinc/manganese transport system substrate-binding protein